MPCARLLHGLEAPIYARRQAVRGDLLSLLVSDPIFIGLGAAILAACRLLRSDALFPEESRRPARLASSGSIGMPASDKSNIA
jgi:hypothetical protein